jgi:hypothetical protein
MTPKQAWNKKRPFLNHLRMFRHATYTKKLDGSKAKLEPKRNRCDFIGYNLDCKAYGFIEEFIGKLIISWDVVFNEAMTKDSSTKFNARRQKIERDSSINMELENVDEVGAKE